MKQSFLLILAFFATSIIATAQTDLPRPQVRAPVAADAIQQGNWILGADIGNLGYNFKSETFSFEIMPRAGLFVSDNAVIGIQTQLGLIAYDNGEQFYYGLTPFARYYFPEGARASGRWFGEAVVGFAGSSLENSDEDAIFSSVFGLRAGYAHFVGQNVALEGSIGYTRTNSDIDIGTAKSGLSLGFGFNIYLPGRNNRNASE
jgi:hypothetical protein